MRNLLTSRLNISAFKHNIKTHRAYFILFTILFFIAFPTSFILRILRTGFPLSGYDSGIPWILIFLTGIACFFMPFITQNYLYSKKAVDVYHALPIKRNDLLLTNSVSSFLIVFIPYTLNYFLGYLILYTYNAQVLNITVLLYYCLSAILFLAIQICNTFVIMNTGTLSNGLIHAFVLFLAPFIAYGATAAFTETFIFGISSFDEISLAYISPTYALFRLVYNAPPKQLLFISGVWIIITFIFGSINHNLYVKRKSEKSEEPFTNTRYFPVVASLFTGLVLLGMMAIFSLTNSASRYGLREFISIDTFLIPMGITFVMYIILDIFRYKSTKNFLKAMIHYFIIASTTVVIGILMITTNMFGYGNFFPSAASVKEAKVTIPQSFYPVPSDDYYQSTLTLTEQESIEELLVFHRLILDFYKENPNYDYTQETYIFDHIVDAVPPQGYGSEISIQYKVRGGFSVNRRYDLPNNIGANIYTLMNNWDVQKNLHPILDSSIELKDNQRVSLYSQAMTQKSTVSFNEPTRTAFISAYEKDLRAIDDETFAFGSSELKYVLTYTTTMQISSMPNTTPVKKSLFIDSRFVHTLDYLESIKEMQSNAHASNAVLSLADIDSYSSSYTQYGMPISSTTMIKSDYGIYDDNILNNTQAKELMPHIEGAHIRNTALKVLIAEVDGVLYLLPVNSK